MGRLDYKRGDDWKKEVKGKSWEGREKKGMEIERWGEGKRGKKEGGGEGLRACQLLSSHICW